MRADNHYPYLLSAPNFYQHMRMRMQLTKNPYLRMTYVDADNGFRVLYI
jgi:hypothetical protein